jgi:uncharacterized surface protein with fasciclin (FAS1) repeats
MKRIILGVGLVLVLAFGATACGGDDESSDSDAVDIVDTAVAAGSFETLASLLESAGLVDTLKGEGPYTVFAPTDDAFAKLPQETLDSLADPANAAELEEILLYHVAEGEVPSSDLSDGQEIETLQGGSVTVGIADDGTVTVQSATVTQPDVEASNGVIHVIDTVLLPE